MAYDHGHDDFDTVRLLLAGDPHLWQNPMDPERDIERINWYGRGSEEMMLSGEDPGENYDVKRLIEKEGIYRSCDGLIVPGDVAKDKENVQMLVDEGHMYDNIRIAYGNNDEFDPFDLYGDENDEIDSTVVWDEVYGNETYTFSMKHDPARYRIKRGSSKASNQNPENKDILIAAHNHEPKSKILDDGLLYINPGSIFSNYTNDGFSPSNSIFMVDIDETVTISHYDYDRAELVSRDEYVRINGVFRSVDDLEEEENDIGLGRVSTA